MAADDQELPALIEQARAAQPEAWNRLVALFQPRLLDAAQRLTGPRWPDLSPRDLTQEAWLRARRGIASYRGGPFLVWLQAILQNVYRNARRAARGRQARLHLPIGISAASEEPPLGPAFVEPAADTSSVSKRLVAEERASQLQAALATLAPDVRAILTMSVQDPRLPFAEIGVRLGLSERQVLTRYHHALAQLRLKLKELRE